MIPIKTQKEIEVIREGGRILATIMEELKEQVKPGVSTKDLDRAAEALVFDYKAEPAFKGYEGFPCSLCVSVNEQAIVHAAPSDYVLKEGDIVSLDLGIKYKGFFTDMAITVIARGSVCRGQTPPKLHTEVFRGSDPCKLTPADSTPANSEALRLIRVTKKALKLGIKKARAGNTVGDVANTIQRFVEYQGFNVVRELCGHGIGRDLHEEPKIPNYGKRHKGPELKEGMVICIEPMTTMGDWHLKKTEDGFGYTTQDGSLSCHFEHTVAIGKEGGEVLTKL